MSIIRDRQKSLGYAIRVIKAFTALCSSGPAVLDPPRVRKALTSSLASGGQRNVRRHTTWFGSSISLQIVEVNPTFLLYIHGSESPTCLILAGLFYPMARGAQSKD